MKKWIGLLCSAALLVSQWSFTPTKAYADELTVDQKADILNQIYVLSGDGTSYNLGGKLKRSEASTFIVKVLGAQNTVLQQKDTFAQTSFRDVPKSEWYAPYVGYMTKMGIITGYPDGTFKPDEYISEKAFFSMVLKAMGYTGNDFTWDTINKLAYEAGIITDITYVFKQDDNTNYKRSDVVNTLYNALGKPMKNQNKKFIQLLIDSKMIGADKAELFGFVKLDKVATAALSSRTLNQNQIEVVLNEAVVAPTLDQISIYANNNPNIRLAAKKVTVNGTQIVIDTDTQSDKITYTVELNKLTDLSGNVTAQIRRDFIGYTVAEVNSPYFKISKVEPVNEKSINVYFTHPVNDKADLEVLYDFYQGDTKFVEGSYKSLLIKRYETKNNMITLSLRENKFALNTDYTLKIRGDLKSAYSVNLNKGNGETAVFRAVEGIQTTNGLAAVYSQEGIYVYVTFSQAVDRASGMTGANYVIRELDTGRLVNVAQVYGLKSAKDLDKSFVLRTTGLNTGRGYEITVRNIYDTYKSAVLSEMKTQFTGSATIGDFIILESATAMNSSTVILSFNRELKESSINANILIENGPSVMYKEIDPTNPKNLILYLNNFSTLQNGRPYVVRVYSGIVDFMDKTALAQGLATVIGTSIQKPTVAIESANFIDESTILLKYNQPVNKTQAGQLERYELFFSDGKTERALILSSVEMVSDRVAIIKIPYLMAQGTYKIQARNIMDVSGQSDATAISAEVK